ncbi:hypothetical protein SCP_0905090 [Sparassis crispa]|uniref:Uncharacterized protein n=1 Tax=Sparassis crispa TaxID=139825 RepID=A0A401GWQ7_9APHY|nr:hypothetical protein SCP_0905090 [Sparassis crispa]GBE86630.1 hypothetical protein SCP_0905090 [Sparassis crispa]
MPPQPGLFALPYSSTHKARSGTNAEVIETTGTAHRHQAVAGPSRTHGSQTEDQKRERKKKEIVGKLGKEMSDRRDDAGRHYAEIISELHSTSLQLSTRPETLPAYNLRLYPLTLERSALLASLVLQERHALDGVQTAYEEERERVEDEWKRGRERIRERLLEGIEERRRRAREEKDGEGAVVDVGMDAQSRPHNTRKLRNKLGGTSPPPTPLSAAPGLGLTNGTSGSNGNGSLTNGTFLNPLSLSVDELPSPFPLPLTAAHLHLNSAYNNGAGGGTSRRRAKGTGKDAQILGGLGKSLAILNTVKESEVEQDLGEIRRGNKRRRVAATTLAGKGG